MKSMKKRIMSLVLAFIMVLAMGFSGNQVKAQDVEKITLKPTIVLQFPKEVDLTEEHSVKIKGTLKEYQEQSIDNIADAEIKAIADLETEFTFTNEDTVKEVEGHKEIVKTAEDMFPIFPKAGRYKYELEEDVPEPKDDNITYDTKQYEVIVVVGKDESGGFEPKSMAIYDPSKVTEDNNGKIDLKDFKFVNGYYKQDGDDGTGDTTPTEEEKKGLTVTKKVMGEEKAGDFEIEIKLYRPIGSPKDEDLTKKPVATKYSMKPSADPETPNEPEPVTISYDKAKNVYTATVTLKHNQKVVFNNVLLGSRLFVKELDTSSAGYEVQYERDDGKDPSVENPTGDAIVRISDKGNNIVDVVNNPETISGVLIDNLPFIILIAVAVTGIAIYSKNRKMAQTK